MVATQIADQHDAGDSNQQNPNNRAADTVYSVEDSTAQRDHADS